MGILATVRTAQLLIDSDAPRLIQEARAAITRAIKNAQQDELQRQRWEDDGGTIR